VKRLTVATFYSYVEPVRTEDFYTTQTSHPHLAKTGPDMGRPVSHAIVSKGKSVGGSLGSVEIFSSIESAIAVHEQRQVEKGAAR
jgi:hypothetical protein